MPPRARSRNSSWKSAIRSSSCESISAAGAVPGFQYGFSFDEERAEDDIAVENDGVTLLVDPLSFQYLMGAEVDYTESLQGAQFVIRNPNAATTCGCGSSFSI